MTNLKKESLIAFVERRL